MPLVVHLLDEISKHTPRFFSPQRKQRALGHKSNHKTERLISGGWGCNIDINSDLTSNNNVDNCDSVKVSRKLNWLNRGYNHAVQQLKLQNILLEKYISTTRNHFLNYKLIIKFLVSFVFLLITKMTVIVNFKVICTLQTVVPDIPGR